MTRIRSARRENPRGDCSGDARAPQAMAGGAAIPWRYPDRPRLAPGKPGAQPHLAPAAKVGVGPAATRRIEFGSLSAFTWCWRHIWVTGGPATRPGLASIVGHQCYLQSGLAARWRWPARQAGSKAQPATWACRTAGKILRGASESHANMIVQMTGTWHSWARSISAPAEEVASPAVIHWTIDGWQTSRESKSRDTGLGMHVVDLRTRDIRIKGAVELTFYRVGVDRWEGTNFIVTRL